MLLKFSVSNYRSFRDESILNMLASLELKDSGCLITEDQGRTVLPCNLIYGANAGGKSNLVRAMRVAVNFIVSGGMIPHDPFKLNSSAVKFPSVFQFLYSFEGKTYSYGFSVSKDGVEEEELYELNGETSPVFKRRKNEFTFFPKIFTEDENAQFFEVAGKLVPNNKLFMSEAIERKIKVLRSASKWFKNGIQFTDLNRQYILEHESQLIGACEKNSKVRDLMNQIVRTADVGIEEISVADQPMSTEEMFRFLNGMPKAHKDDILNAISGDKVSRVETVQVDMSGDGESRRFVFNKGTAGHQYNLVLSHKSVEGVISFSFSAESDGTRVFLAMMPMLWNAKNNKDVTFVIDEIDKSLHTKLLQHFLEMFLSDTQKTQLIATIHDVWPMNMQELRADGITLVTKTPVGVSRLAVLAEYENFERFKGHYAEAYLNDRFSGIPYVKSIEKDEEDA